MLLINKARLTIQLMVIFTVLSLVQLTAAVAQGQSNSHHLKVTIDISPNLKSKTQPEQVIFVFAKAVRGPRAPLAAVKAQVKDLPMTVTLDDSMAIAPMFRLSNFSDVKVSARVSQSGQAIKQSGDLEGLSPDIKLGKNNKPITIIIDHIVP
jgi:cytochrome c-type biogenesis protein CcmH